MEVSKYDIVMVSYQRWEYTRKTLEYLKERTKTPYRLILVDNCSDPQTQRWLLKYKEMGFIDHLIILERNYGIHMAKNYGLAFVRTTFRYYIDTDNDILVPDLEPDWLSRLVTLMDNNPEYGAIALQPQIMVGRGPVPETAPEVCPISHIGAYMRIMRIDLVKKVGGWKKIYNAKRNDEEKTICSKIYKEGFKVGVARDLRCWHLFGKNWGYPEDLKPEDHGHRPVWPPPEHYDKVRVDPKTWQPL